LCFLGFVKTWHHPQPSTPSPGSSGVASNVAPGERLAWRRAGPVPDWDAGGAVAVGAGKAVTQPCTLRWAPTRRSSDGGESVMALVCFNRDLIVQTVLDGF